MKFSSPSKTILHIFFASFFILLVGCDTNNLPAPIDIADEFTNQQVQIRVAPFGNTFKTTDPVFLELKYNSNNTIVFPNNYNLKIFERNDNQWLEIQEKPTIRLPEGDIVFAPNIQMPIAEAVVVYPDLSDLYRTYQLRIYVIGEMQTNNETQKVTAYVDFEVSP